MEEYERGARSSVVIQSVSRDVPYHSITDDVNSHSRPTRNHKKVLLQQNSVEPSIAWQNHKVEPRDSRTLVYCTQNHKGRTHFNQIEHYGTTSRTSRTYVCPETTTSNETPKKRKKKKKSTAVRTISQLPSASMNTITISPQDALSQIHCPIKLYKQIEVYVKPLLVLDVNGILCHRINQGQ